MHLHLHFLFLAASLLSFAGAQQQLAVNGTFVEGLRTDLVAGSAYAPAEPYARALGAEYRFDARSGVLLSFGGRLLSLQSFATPTQAAGATTALVVDGQRVPSSGAVRVGEAVYLPVKSVTAALGGRTAYLAEAQTVAVVFPRPNLTAVSPPGVWGSYERFILTFDAPVYIETFFEPSLGVVRFRFPRAALSRDELSGRPFDLSGGRINDAVLVSSSTFLDFNVTLQRGNTYRTFSERYRSGERVVIDVFRDTAESAAGTVRSAVGGNAVGAQVPVMVLCAEPGTVALAQRIEAALTARGVRVELQTTPTEAVQPGFATPFLLTLRRASLPVGTFNVYYLPQNAPSLGAPVRRAPVDTALSDEARAQLARLSPDAAFGERMARGLATGLEGRTSLTLGSLLAAPLWGLSGAAGRGVMLELAPTELSRPATRAALAETLAPLIRTLLQRG